MRKQEENEWRPSLLERQSRGGDIAEGGLSFQSEVVLSMIPRWVSMEGFNSMTRENMADTEAKFFVPGRGYKKEFIEVKDHQVPPAEFWDEVERFKQMESGCPGEYQWFTFVSAGLSQSLHPLVNSLRRMRDPYDFYEESAIMDNSYAEYVQLVKGLGKSEEDADFLFRKVLINGDLSTARDHGAALFQQSLLTHLLHYRDIPGSVLRDIYADVSSFVRNRRIQPISRNELEAALRNRIPERSLPPVQPVRIHTAMSDLETDADRTALRFEWSQFFAGETREYPPPEVWNEQMLGELRATKEWILANRATRRILLSGNRRLSTSLAIGSVFSAVAGFSIEMQYRDQLYVTDAHAGHDTPVYSILSLAPKELSEGERLVVSVGIMRDVVPEVESDLERHGLANMPRLHLKGEAAVLSPQQANLIVRQIKDLISVALSQTGARQIDLFIAAPAFLALFLGHRLNATAPVQCYERLSPSRYVPSCTLFR
jgi:hypothetical protein